MSPKQPIVVDDAEVDRMLKELRMPTLVEHGYYTPMADCRVDFPRSGTHLLDDPGRPLRDH